MEEPTAKSAPRINPRTNGPLLVSGLTRLRNSKGEELETKRTIALCRCGGSANKPFCDGTHAKNGFSSTNPPAAKNGFDSEDASTAKVDYVERYEGPEVTILDNRSLCAHIGACTDGLANVFLYGQEPWIDPAGADAGRITEVIQRCPSGALAYAVEGQETRDFNRDPGVTVSKNGPYFVVGNVELEVERRGEGASREHFALCRCGASKNKPFCDGSHWDAGFSDDKN